MIISGFFLSLLFHKIVLYKIAAPNNGNTKSTENC